MGWRKLKPEALGKKGGWYGVCKNGMEGEKAVKGGTRRKFSLRNVMDYSRRKDWDNKTKPNHRHSPGTTQGPPTYKCGSHICVLGAVNGNAEG